MKTLNFHFSTTAFAVAIVAIATTSCGKVVINRGGGTSSSQEITVSSSSGGTGTSSSGGTSSGGGTSSSGSTSETQVTCYQDQYNEAPAVAPSGPPKVDVLFEVSSAATLDAYRFEIADAIYAWVATLPQGVDYRFAVMLAHSQDQWSGVLYPGCDGGPLVLRSDQLTPGEIGEYLRERIIANPGEAASDGGEGFTISLQKSLQLPNSGTIMDEGFYRADASLELVTMTARNDICWIPQDYPGGAKPTTDPFYAVEQTERAAQCTGYSSQAATSLLQQFKSPYPVVATSFAFTPTSTIPAGSNAVIGYTEMSLMNQLGGTVIPLDQPTNFVTDLAPLAQVPTPPSSATTPPQTSFELRTTDALLNASTLTVTVNGNSAPYTLNSSTMDLSLSPSFTLNPGSVVDIDYCTIAQPVSTTSTP